MSLPSGVTGCRYYQVDLTANRLDAVRNRNAAYVDFGDGYGMRMGTGYIDIPTYLAPNTTAGIIHGGDIDQMEAYFIHTYKNDSLKTLTLYHNDATEREDFDNMAAAPTGLTKLSNLRGNLPQNTPDIGGSCYQNATMSSVANVTNWNSISSIKNFRLNNGDLVSPSTHIGYAQDFLQNNKGLISIYTSLGYYRNGVRDTTFKISRLKSDWNTYFTNIQWMMINDEHWNREDLSALVNLRYFQLWATTQDHQDDINSPLIPIPQSVVDNVISQIDAGAGKYISNGYIYIATGDAKNSSGSTDAVARLKAKGWIILINSTYL
jgi:hypothetical protein